MLVYTLAVFSLFHLGSPDHRPVLGYNPDQVHLHLKELETLYKQENELQTYLSFECQKQGKTLESCIFPISPPPHFLNLLNQMPLKQLFGTALVLKRDHLRGFGQNPQSRTKEASGILLNGVSNALYKRNWCRGPSKKLPQKQHFILCSDDKDPQPFS